jgi:hypothetical protein
MNAEDRDLIGRLFALMTAKAEDTAALAVEGQNRAMPIETLRARIASIQMLTEEIVAVSATADLFLRGADHTSQND